MCGASKAVWRAKPAQHGVMDVSLRQSVTKSEPEF
jgi:hypothetical protein